jgi:hypothetical protein
MSFDLDPVVEVTLETFFKLYAAAICGRLGDCNLQDALPDNPMIGLIVFSSVVNIHLECEKGKGELISDESKCFRDILLLYFSSFFPTAIAEGIL